MKISNIVIRQDAAGLYCLNDFYRASGAFKAKQPANFVRLATTQELLKEINRSSDVRNAQKTNSNRCSDVSNALSQIRGGLDQGTYTCKELVYAYAMWISPAFHLKVIRAFDAMMVQQHSAKVAAKIVHKPEVDTQAIIKQAMDVKLSILPKENRLEHYPQLWTKLKKHFGVTKYSQFKVTQLPEVIEHIATLDVPFFKLLEKNAPKAELPAVKPSESLQKVIADVNQHNSILPKRMTVDAIKHGHTRVDFLLRDLVKHGVDVSTLIQEMSYIRNLVGFSSTILASFRALALDCDLSRSEYCIS